jgi:hypothetical protein
MLSLSYGFQSSVGDRHADRPSRLSMRPSSRYPGGAFTSGMGGGSRKVSLNSLSSPLLSQSSQCLP